MQHEVYKTTDIVLAAFLRLNGHPIAQIEKNGLKGTFVFSNIGDDLLKKYDLGQALVEPVAFNNMIKQLTTSVRRIEQ
jgi:hypothetical protein